MTFSAGSSCSGVGFGTRSPQAGDVFLSCASSARAGALVANKKKVINRMENSHINTIKLQDLPS